MPLYKVKNPATGVVHLVGSLANKPKPHSSLYFPLCNGDAVHAVALPLTDKLKGRPCKRCVVQAEKLHKKWKAETAALGKFLKAAKVGK